MIIAFKKVSEIHKLQLNCSWKSPKSVFICLVQWWVGLVHFKNVRLEPSEKETLWNVNMEEIKGVDTKRVCQNQLCSISEYKKRMHCIHIFLYAFQGIITALPLHCTHTHTYTHSGETTMYTLSLFVSSTDSLPYQLCCQQPACRWRGRYGVRTNATGPLLKISFTG